MKASNLKLFLVFLLTVFFAGCTSSNTSVETKSSVRALTSLYKNGEYFKLRDRLSRKEDIDEPKELFLAAVIKYVFNKPEESNQIIKDLFKSNTTLADTLMNKLRSVKMKNHLRLFEYRRALEVAKTLLNHSIAKTDSAVIADVKNMSHLFKVLANVPPQKVIKQSSTRLQIKRDKAGLQRIPVQINGISRHFVFDTGAGLSVMMRSTAEKLGLEIIKVPGFTAQSATGGKVAADVAVAKKVVLGNTVFKNVIFMVFPDKALSFQRINYKISGIIGFPVIEAAGEIHLSQKGTFGIPATTPARGTHNLALEGLSPRVLVDIAIPSGASVIHADSLICTFDTGGARTTLLASFYRHYKSNVKKIGRPDTVGFASAGGSRQMKVYRLPKIKLNISDTTAVLNEVRVYTQNTFAEDIACNIGQDVIGQFDEIVINFESMSLLLL